MQYVRIRNLREDMDMTQTDMAKVLFISQRTYSYYESGGHDIPTEILVRLADFYDVSVDYLLERTEKKAVNR
ncbi:helix-turn-helix transcriptional regulator [Ruminococcus sp.]|uniref:helix-turn-helix domain-containing protein n=1 Tax=Ruminococcus sp. TaxID=41978 RepID=UPI0025DCBC05|nr:helix-turn-helix transcriptional regulator [Ruminococcus sp.]